MRNSTRAAMSASNSSSTSSWMDAVVRKGGRKSFRKPGRNSKRDMCRAGSGALGGEHGRQRVELIDEPLRLGAQVRAPGLRHPVVARAPAILRDRPLRSDELAFFHTMQRLEQG